MSTVLTKQLVVRREIINSIKLKHSPSGHSFAIISILKIPLDLEIAKEDDGISYNELCKKYERVTVNEVYINLSSLIIVRNIGSKEECYQVRFNDRAYDISEKDFKTLVGG